MIEIISKPGIGFMDYRKILLEFNIQEKDKIADFGCGSGYFPIALAKAVGPEGIITAIDVLPSALELVYARAQNDNLLNIIGKRANLEILGSSGLLDDSQDIVLLINILHQTENKAGVIAEAKRVVKPSGQIIIVDYLPNTMRLGPAESLRISPDVIKPLAQSAQLELTREFKAGDYHWGMVFRKIF
ncbi:methyltransferase domain-containing protein [Candidatus Azambacteria bacterium]|nr:methyltransferase domain-containing protein [Candidatus Azambacteria bacterium]